jgi:hypothetical protein
MDSAGDIIIGGALGVTTKLDSGTDTYYLQAKGAASPIWRSPANVLSDIGAAPSHLTGWTPEAGEVLGTDTVRAGMEKLDGNIATKQNLDSDLTAWASGINTVYENARTTAPTGADLVQGRTYPANSLDWDPNSKKVTTGAIATIAFVEGGAGADTITDSNSGLVIAGFKAHMRIKVSGSASNDGYYTIDTVTAGTATLVTTDDLTAEDAGATVTMLGGFRYLTQWDQDSWTIKENENGEVFTNATTHRIWTFDPKAVCDGAVDRLFLMTIGSESADGIYIDSWSVSYEANPDTEADLDLKRADAFIGVGNAAVMDVLDTTAGVASETTAANINGGAVVALTKVLYLEFGTAYTEANHQVIFELWYHNK